MIEWLAVTISALALTISIVTGWLTLFRRGQLRMTKPTVIFLGPDGGRRDGRPPRLKVFLRTLLYSTSQQGQIVESLHVNLQRGESRQNFSIWVYGDDRLARGSGMHVGREGVVCNHHFLLPEDGASFTLFPGEYLLRVFGKRVGAKDATELARTTLQITEVQSEALQSDHTGIYFDWGPDQQAYQSHVEVRVPDAIPSWLFDPEHTAPGGAARRSR